MMTRKQFFRELLLNLGQAASGAWTDSAPELEPPHHTAQTLSASELSPSLMMMEAERLGMDNLSAVDSAALRRLLYAKMVDRTRTSGSDNGSKD
jgi:hypothetical protein